MSDACTHRWGAAEECETTLGTFFSPVCRDCGAVKLEVDRNARQRFDIERLWPKPPSQEGQKK